MSLLREAGQMLKTYRGEHQPSCYLSTASHHFLLHGRHACYLLPAVFLLSYDRDRWTPDLTSKRRKKENRPFKRRSLAQKRVFGFFNWCTSSTPPSSLTSFFFCLFHDSTFVLLFVWSTTVVSWFMPPWLRVKEQKAVFFMAFTPSTNIGGFVRCINCVCVFCAQVVQLSPNARFSS